MGNMSCHNTRVSNVAAGVLQMHKWYKTFAMRCLSRLGKLLILTASTLQGWAFQPIFIYGNLSWR